MPTPGPVAYQVQSDLFTSLVISTGLAQVTPSSSLFVTQTVRAFLTRAIKDHSLGIAAEVVGQKKPDGAGARIDDGAGIAAGVVAVVPDDLRLRPRLAAVETALEQQIDVAGIVAALFTALAEG